MSRRTRSAQASPGHLHLVVALYGTDALYVDGALRLARQVATFRRPHYAVVLHVYHDDSVSPNALSSLSELGAHLHDMTHLGYVGEQRMLWRIRAIASFPTCFLMDVDGRFFEFFVQTEASWIERLAAPGPVVACSRPSWISYGNDRATLPGGFTAFSRATESPALLDARRLVDQVVGRNSRFEQTVSLHRPHYGVDEFVLNARLLPTLLAEGTPVWVGTCQTSPPFVRFARLPDKNASIRVVRDVVGADVTAALHNLCEATVKACDRAIQYNVDLLHRAQNGRLDSVALVGTNRRQYRLDEASPVLRALDAAVRARWAGAADLVLHYVDLFRSQPGTGGAQKWHRDDRREGSCWVVSVGLQELTGARNGQTEFLLASETEPLTKAFVASASRLQPCQRASDVLLFDSRVIHRGVGNPSDTVRDVLQLDYCVSGLEKVPWQGPRLYGDAQFSLKV